MKALTSSILLFSLFAGSIAAQPGPIKNLRSEDDFSYLLKDSTVQRSWPEKLKYVSLNKSETLVGSFGGEWREWYELRGNVNFGDLPPGLEDDPDGTLLHRAMVHVDVRFKKKWRLFAQLNNTYELGTSNQPLPEISQDALGLHQVFVEYDFAPTSMILRVGRQEFNFGNELLVSSREGPNNRLAFDGISGFLKKDHSDIHLFVATPIIIESGYFDNQRINEYLWGGYADLRSQKKTKLDLYYLGFSSDRRRYNLISGSQTRHTIGARLWSLPGTVHYDIEGVYQFGEFNNLRISAYNFTGSGSYTFSKKWKPTIGAGGSYISGDRSATDHRLNTYDALYARPTFGLAAPLGPSNIISRQPFVSVSPLRGMTIKSSVYFLSRQSTADGTYAPSMVQVRPFPPFESEHRSIGTQYAIDVFYAPNPHLMFISFLSYVAPGAYVKDTGSGRPIYYTSLAAILKF